MGRFLLNIRLLKNYSKMEKENNKMCENCVCISFTKDEVKMLKEIVRERKEESS